MASSHRSERQLDPVMTRMDVGDRVCLGLEYFTGATAIVGGLLLLARPDGALLQAEPSVLATSPFTDWRVPGLLLTVLVGGGFMIAAECHRRRWAHDRLASTVAGTGLIAFEFAELAWIGFQPLEVVFGLVGVAVVLLAIRSSSNRPHLAGSARWRGQRSRTKERQVT